MGASCAAVGRLLCWYDANRRTLPWREVKPNPYHVWLSEIMLQQTTVSAVGQYYRKFIRRWPTAEALAAAPRDDVLAAWAGLGYYARARNMHKAAQAVAAAGGFPKTVQGLLALPGVGPYTAGAIAAIAFNVRVAAVDANAERVIARWFAVTEPLPAAKKIIREWALELVPVGRPGDFAQSLMDLGASICTPRPACPRCPLAGDCAAYARGIAESLPVRPAKKARPLRRTVAFVAWDGAGRVLLTRRPEKGLLGGMWQPPVTPLEKAKPSSEDIAAAEPFSAQWKTLPGGVSHGFTHFVLEVGIRIAIVTKAPTVAGGRWVAYKKIGQAGLPSLMRKIVDYAYGFFEPVQKK